MIDIFFCFVFRRRTFISIDCHFSFPFSKINNNNNNNKVKRENGGRGIIQLELTYKINHSRIKEIHRHYNRLDATVSKHTHEKKKKLIRKENDFFKQPGHTLKEKDKKKKTHTKKD